MLFNSIDFAIFLPIVFILYWLIGSEKLRQQNALLLAASYLFYGWWDFRFLALIVFSSLVDYLVGLGLARENSQDKRKWLLSASLIANLGLLAFFKYFNFFIENFVEAFSFFGADIQANSLNIILPVGISFYTFQTLSYSIDVYRRKIEPTKDIIAFFSFVSFFPQLVAGPIERAANLLPQFYSKRIFDYSKAVDGLRQVLWGLFKKVVIADNCAEYANLIFNDPSGYSGSTLALGAVLFAFQIYGDFSGYSDIAIGTARLFGFDLAKNFAFPYFSRDIAEFWRRWHISLSTWFRDYLYIPLGGSRGSSWVKIRNIFMIFIVSGFWHGANWTFIAWGALNAIYFLPLMLMNRNREHLETVAQGRIFPSIADVFNMVGTFILTTLAWIFFRSQDIGQAIDIIAEIFSPSVVAYPSLLPFWLIAIIAIFLIVEWLGREEAYAIANLNLRWPKLMRWSFYYGTIAMIFLFSGKEQEFIYFQF